MPLIYESFISDPRVAEARELIKEALEDHQGRIKGVRGPEADLIRSYEERLKRLSEVRARPLALPYLGSGIGRGALVELADGSIKYDLITGIGVHYFGHSHPALMGALLESAMQNTVMQGNLQQNEEVLTLSARLLRVANQGGADLEHCFLTTSGAMANENALKMAFQKRSPADRLLAFEGNFAGRTFALSQVTDRPHYRLGLPHTLLVDYVPFFDSERPVQSIEEALDVLKGHLSRYPGRHAAMIFELVRGEGGFYPGSREFFEPLMKRLREEGVVIITDEIQTFGRTTKPFAFQYFGLDPYVDIVTVGKLTQACATLFRKALAPTPELVSQTFSAGTSVLAAANTILEQLLQGEYFGERGKIARLHKKFVDGLEDLSRRHPGWIKGPFGIGVMIAFTPFDGSKKIAKTLMEVLYDRGVISFIAGEGPTRIRFLLPAGVMTMEDADAVMGILDQSLALVAEKLKQEKGPVS